MNAASVQEVVQLCIKPIGHLCIYYGVHKNSSLNVLMSSYSWCNTDGDETTATTGNNYF